MLSTAPQADLLCGNDSYAQEAFSILKRLWPNRCELIVLNGNAKPQNFSDLIRGKALFSFRCHAILSKIEIQSTLFAINFHPAPEDLRGVGGYNFAIYQERKDFGVLAHIMREEVDSGKIFAIKRFEISDKETVESLKTKSNIKLLTMFEEVIISLLGNDGPPDKNLRRFPDVSEWSGALKKRKDLDSLCTIRLGMSDDEMLKRQRACHYPPDHSLQLKVKDSLFCIKRILD